MSRFQGTNESAQTEILSGVTVLLNLTNKDNAFCYRDGTDLLVGTNGFHDTGKSSIHRLLSQG